MSEEINIALIPLALIGFFVFSCVFLSLFVDGFKGVWENIEAIVFSFASLGFVFVLFIMVASVLYIIKTL